MIKVEVINEDFTLERFGELKNIVRKNKEEKGKLFKGDVFECSEELCDYLSGNNPLKKAVVKIIEIKPKKENKEEETKVVLEEKPKKKKSSKKYLFLERNDIMATDIGGVWRTVGGRRIFIKDGDDLESAMKSSGKFRNNKKDNSKKHDYSDFNKSKIKETLYHGTDKDFDKFDFGKNDEGNNALWFGKEKDYAEEMAYERAGSYEKGKMYEVKINVQNPETIKLSSNQFSDPNVEKKYIENAKTKGYDSVIFNEIKKDGSKGDTFYAVFSEKQVKILKKYNIK